MGFIYTQQNLPRILFTPLNTRGDASIGLCNLQLYEMNPKPYMHTSSQVFEVIFCSAIGTLCSIS